MDNPKRIFTKLSILLFSALGSTFFGSLLYAQNLRETEKGKFIAPTLVFSVIYSVVVIKVSTFFGIQIYYSFIPLHLLGGLILIGPFWKYHMGVIGNFQKRKIWMPIIILAIPIAFIIFLNIYYSPKKLSAKEFQDATIIEVNKQRKNELYISKDSSTQFFDISIPLLSSSYTFTTHVEDVNTLYNFKDFEEGRFSVVCVRMPLSDKEEFNLNLLGKEFSSVSVKKCNNGHFESMICADYTRKMSDTVSVKGSVVLIKADRIFYQFITQFVELDKASADSVSNYLTDKIKLFTSK